MNLLKGCSEDRKMKMTLKREDNLKNNIFKISMNHDSAKRVENVYKPFEIIKKI